MNAGFPAVEKPRKQQFYYRLFVYSERPTCPTETSFKTG